MTTEKTNPINVIEEDPTLSNNPTDVVSNDYYEEYQTIGSNSGDFSAEPSAPVNDDRTYKEEVEKVARMLVNLLDQCTGVACSMYSGYDIQTYRANDDQKQLLTEQFTYAIESSNANLEQLKRLGFWPVILIYLVTKIIDAMKHKRERDSRRRAEALAEKKKDRIEVGSTVKIRRQQFQFFKTNWESQGKIVYMNDESGAPLKRDEALKDGYIENDPVVIEVIKNTATDIQPMDKARFNAAVRKGLSEKGYRF